MNSLTLFDWLLLAFSVDAIMVLWFRGSLFTTPRAYAEAWSESENLLKRAVGEHLTCPICLPFSLAVALTGLLVFIPYSKGFVLIISVAGLAGRIYQMCQSHINGQSDAPYMKIYKADDKPDQEPT